MAGGSSNATSTVVLLLFKIAVVDKLARPNHNRHAELPHDSAVSRD